MFVTDAHPLLWYLTGKRSLLSTKVLTAFDEAVAGSSFIQIPTVVLWEIAILDAKGRIKLDNTFEHWAGKVSATSGFNIVQLETPIIARSVGYNFNNDIFDKVIVATAVEHDLPLITKDVAITDSNLIEVYW